MATKDVTKETFEYFLKKSRLMVAFFWGEKCNPCKAFAPVYEQVSECNNDVFFAKINTAFEDGLNASHHIRSVPTLKVFCEEIAVFTHVGILTAKSLQSVLDRSKKLDMNEVRSQLGK